MSAADEHERWSTDQEVVRSIHAAFFRHPVAMQAAFAALVAEGRRYAATPEGAELRAKLEGSDLVHRARVLWDVTTMGVFEEAPEGPLPSAMIESLCRLAAEGSMEQFAIELMEELDV